MKKNLSIAAISCMVMIVIMQWQGSSLKTPNARQGILALEFARTPEMLQTVVTGWDLSAVKMNIWLDFVFIVTYVVFLSMAAEITAGKWGKIRWLSQIGLFLARVAYVAGVLDIAENLMMLKTLSGSYDVISLQLTFYCAAVKFVLAGMIIVYLFLSLPRMIQKKGN